VLITTVFSGLRGHLSALRDVGGRYVEATVTFGQENAHAGGFRRPDDLIYPDSLCVCLSPFDAVTDTR